jgi:hypothetical protein
MPALTRQVIMRLEHHRRGSVGVWELSVLAAALEISPVLLIYPLGLAGRPSTCPGGEPGRSTRRAGGAARSG